jgi:hypothetical protein
MQSLPDFSADSAVNTSFSVFPPVDLRGIVRVGPVFAETDLRYLTALRVQSLHRV